MVQTYTSLQSNLNVALGVKLGFLLQEIVPMWLKGAAVPKVIWWGIKFRRKLSFIEI
jgi:hypothetical protein